MSINESANQALLGLKKDLEEDEKNGGGSKWENISDGIDFGKKNNSFRLDIGHSFESGDGKKYTVESIKSMGDLVVASLDVDGTGTIDVAIVGGEIKGDVLELVLTDPESGEDLGTITIDRNISKGKPPLVSTNPDDTISKDKKDDIIISDDDKKNMTTPKGPGGAPAPKKVPQTITPETKAKLLELGMPEKEIASMTEYAAKKKLAEVKDGLEHGLARKGNGVEQKFIQKISEEYIKLIDAGASEEELKNFIRKQSFILEKDKKGSSGKKTEKTFEDLEDELIKYIYKKSSKKDFKSLLVERRRLHEEGKLKKVDQEYIDEINIWLTNFEKSKSVPGLDAHSVAVFDITIEKLKQLKTRLEKGEKVPKTEMGVIYDEHNKELAKAPRSLDKESQDKLDAINTLIMEFIGKKKLLSVGDERLENIERSVEKLQELRTKVEAGENVEESEIHAVVTQYEASLVEPTSKETILQDNEREIIESKLESIGMSREDLATHVPEFLGLSYGQQLLALDNFNQRITQQSSLEARNRFAEEASDKKTGFFKKLWKGMNKSFYTAKYENQALKKNLSLGVEEKKDILKDLVGQINSAGYEVRGNEVGQYFIEFISVLEGEEKGLNRDVLIKLDLNATNFSKLPIEWSYKEATKDQQKKFQESKNKFAGSLHVYEQELIAGGMSEHKAATIIAELNTQIWGLQASRAHENSDEEIMRMKKNGNFWNTMKQVAKDSLAERSAYFAGAYGARMVATSIVGTIAIPAVAAIFGGYRSGKRAQESLDDLTKRMRLGYKTQEQQLIEKMRNAQTEEERSAAQKELNELRNKGTVNGQMSMELEKKKRELLSDLREAEDLVKDKIPQHILDIKNARYGQENHELGLYKTFGQKVIEEMNANASNFTEQDRKNALNLIAAYEKVKDVEQEIKELRRGDTREKNKWFSVEDVRNRQIVDAKTWIGNFNNMLVKLDLETNPIKRDQLIAKLGTRVEYIQNAIDSGSLNLGGINEQVKNITELTTLMTRAKVTYEMGKKDSELFEEYNGRFEDIQYRLGEAGEFDKLRQNTRLWQQRMKGAVIGATIASAGVLARDLWSGGEIETATEVEKSTEGVTDDSGEEVAKEGDDNLKERGKAPIEVENDSTNNLSNKGEAVADTLSGKKGDLLNNIDENTEPIVETNDQAGEFVNHDFKIEMSSKGAIQTMLDAKAKLAELYDDVPDEKIPPAYKHILETPARKLAQEIGHYRPDDEAESISMLKGSTFEFKDGEVISNSLKNINGEFESEKLFDSEGNLVEGGEDNERFFDSNKIVENDGSGNGPANENADNIIDNDPEYEYGDKGPSDGTEGGDQNGDARNEAGNKEAGDGTIGNEAVDQATDAKKEEMTKRMLRKTRRIWRKGARGLGRAIYNSTGYGSGGGNSNGVELGENYYEGGNKYYGAGRTASYEQNTGGLPTGTSIINPENPSYSSRVGWNNFFDKEFYVGGSGRGKFWASWIEIKNDLASEQFNDRYFLDNHANDKNIGIYEYINKISKEIGKPKDDETVEEYIARGIKAGVKRPKVIR
jgi:hypothetical protein